MKVALYFEGDRVQVVLTPESRSEGFILGTLHEGDRTIKVRRGSFYDCHGGWVRHGEKDHSTMLVLDGDCVTGT